MWEEFDERRRKMSQTPIRTCVHCGKYAECYYKVNRWVCAGCNSKHRIKVGVIDISDDD